jgi:hypothetical protein
MSSKAKHIYFEEAREEIKRADHLIFVSLKYTRTVDIFKSIIERMINCLESTITVSLNRSKEEKLIEEVPTNMGLKLGLFKKTYPGELSEEIVNFLTFLKKVSKADYKRSNEFRRHVTMTVVVEDNVLPIETDTIKEYFVKTKNMVMQMEAVISGEEYVADENTIQ